MGSHSSRSSIETSSSTWRRSRPTRAAWWSFVTRCEDTAANHGTPPNSGVSMNRGTHAIKGAAGKGGRSAATKSKLGAAKPALLAGGNPQIAKADGDGPVQAYIAAMPGWKSDVGRHLDTLIVRTVPGVRKAVKWNSPFYGIEGQGWFLSFHTFTNYVKVTFFQGKSLRPAPPGGKARDARW